MVLGLSVSCLAPCHAQEIQSVPPLSPHDLGPAYPAKSEVELRARYEQFADSLDTIKITREYPKAIQNLLSGAPQRQTTALATLSATGEVETIPWMVPLLDSPDPEIRSWAGVSLEKLVSSTILQQRRNPIPERIALDPLTPDDTDFRPLAWVVYRMLNQRGTEGYAATMIGYIGLKEFEPELRELMASQHPAVTNNVKYALELLEAPPVADTVPLIAEPIHLDDAAR